MAKSRGGQRKHWAEIARIQAWYAEIKRRCDWSDYALDYEFAWTEEGLESRPTDYRPRTFEWIRKESRKPRGRDRRWRNMEELIVAVERNPRFIGTQSLYEAEIWGLLQEFSPTPDAVQERINRLLTANRLVRVPMERAFANIGILAETLDIPSIFDRCLRLSLRQMDGLSRIALVWSLYLQNEPAHNARFRAKIQSVADDLLDHFFARFLPERHLEYYEQAIGVLLQTRLNLSLHQVCGYGFIEAIGTWPVVPEGMLGKLTVEHLVPERSLLSYVRDYC